MYSTYNGGRSVVVERFSETLKIKFISIWLQYQKLCILINYDMVNEYNIACHRSIKMKSNDVNNDICKEFNKEVNDKDPNLKLVIMLEYQNTKTFLPKDTLQIGLKKFLLSVKLKTQFNGHMLLIILMVRD